MSRYIPTRFLDGEAERIVELATAETGENLSKMVRKLVNEALEARGVVSAPREAVTEARHRVLAEIAAGVVAGEEAVEQLVEHHSAEVPPPAFREPAAPKPVRTSGKGLSKVEQQKAMREARYGG